MIVSIIDASANCLIVKAYEYTTILSIMLCDAMCIPATVVISLIFLHSKFALRHYLAVLLCLIGLAVMIIHDAKNSSGTHRVIGDLMALSSSVLYAVSNVCQEVLVKHNDWVGPALSPSPSSERIPRNDRTGRHRLLPSLHHPLRAELPGRHSMGRRVGGPPRGIRHLPLRDVRDHRGNGGRSA